MQNSFTVVVATILGIYGPSDLDFSAMNLIPDNRPRPPSDYSGRYGASNSRSEVIDKRDPDALDHTRSRFYPHYGATGVRRSSNLWAKGKHKNKSRRDNQI